MFHKMLKHTAVWLGMAGMVAGAALMMAQESTSTVHIYANVDGPLFWVDGQEHRKAAVYRWPTGSKHTITTLPLQYDPSWLGVRYSYSDTLPIVYTADPSAPPSVPLVFATEYLISLRFAPCAAGPCLSPGTIEVNGTAYAHDADIWAAAGSTVTVGARPNPGFTFTGWQQIPGGMTNSFVNSFVLREPTGLYPKFEAARQVNLATVPAGLRLNADRQPVETPIAMDWAFNSMHTLSPVSPQNDRWGKSWVFHSWSNGAPALHAFRVEPGSTPVEITANFVPGARFNLRTSPAGLKLQVDGRDDWPTTNFIWGVGETHTVEAPARLTDSQGRTCLFVGWEHGGPAAQAIAVEDGHVEMGVNMTAIYETQSHLLVRSSEPGVVFSVDGEDCPSPCRLERRPGAEIRISAPASVPTADGVRLDFQAWTDGAPRERSFTLNSTDIQSITAAYRTMLRLSAAADPPQAAAFRAEPQSPDGYHEARSNVVLTVEPRPGFRFRKWEGDLTGSVPYGTLRMMGPQSVRALFETVPHVAPAGIRNAAGDTPVEAVAPGSIVSIYGASLAGGIAVGPESPMVQTLGSVTVRMGNRLLPLFFVSPEQINAQLPADVEPGPQRLTVNWEGKPEVQGAFEVMRNAPGLFHHQVEDRAWGAFARADGSAVTRDSPARRGDLLTLYGTGFGPYDRTPPAGFAVPDSPRYRLVDPVVVTAGETVWQLLETVAAPGRIGIDAVRFRVPNDAPSGSLELKVSIQGAESNTVLLAIE